jgi:hypothetical protein
MSQKIRWSSPIFSSDRSFYLCADGGIGGFERGLRARGGASGDAEKREQGKQAFQASTGHRNSAASATVGAKAAPLYNRERVRIKRREKREPARNDRGPNICYGCLRPRRTDLRRYVDAGSRTATRSFGSRGRRTSLRSRAQAPRRRRSAASSSRQKAAPRRALCAIPSGSNMLRCIIGDQRGIAIVSLYAVLHRYIFHHLSCNTESHMSVHPRL